MASILQVHGKWRVHIRRRSHNVCRTFASEDLARQWAATEEARIESLLANDEKDAVTGGATYRVSGVYMLFKHGKIVYIGRSAHIYQRLAYHDRKSAEWDSFKLWPCSDWIRATDLEAKLIAKHQPPLNIAMKEAPKKGKKTPNAFTRYTATRRKDDQTWGDSSA